MLVVLVHGFVCGECWGKNVTSTSRSFCTHHPYDIACAIPPPSSGDANLLYLELCGSGRFSLLMLQGMRIPSSYTLLTCCFRFRYIYIYRQTYIYTYCLHILSMRFESRLWTILLAYIKHAIWIHALDFHSMNMCVSMVQMVLSMGKIPHHSPLESGQNYVFVVKNNFPFPEDPMGLL